MNEKEDVFKYRIGNGQLFSYPTIDHSCTRLYLLSAWRLYTSIDSITEKPIYRHDEKNE